MKKAILRQSKKQDWKLNNYREKEAEILIECPVNNFEL